MVIAEVTPEKHIEAYIWLYVWGVEGSSLMGVRTLGSRTGFDVRDHLNKKKLLCLQSGAYAKKQIHQAT